MSNNFNDLCCDFNKNRPDPLAKPKYKNFLFSTIYLKENWSINDILISYLNGNKMPYLHTLNGDIWFKFNERWTMTQAICNVKTIEFYYLVF